MVPLPPLAVTVLPPEMVTLPLLEMPRPPSSPLAVTVPPEMVRLPLLEMPFAPLPPWAVRLSFSPPEMVRLPLP